MPREGSTTLVTAVSQMPMHGDQPVNFAKPRQVTLTQTLTNAGSTSTAIVTLDRGGPPTEAPPPPDRGAWDSGGLPPRTVGVIVGCSVGALFLILLIYCCCIAAYRRRVADYASDASPTPDEISDDGRTGRPARVPFPWSIPPPTVRRPGQMASNYRARPPPPQWTANNAARHLSKTYMRGQ
ncbi:hypothetical protein DL765_006654 [Monosporascus sp. GIB2]|nr:hypothetical protein DL765_006654 [Monosporascus sp. GIB2]